MSHYSYTFVATQDTFALTQPQQILFEPNTSSFTQLLSTLFSTNLLGSRTFANTEDQPHPYLSTLVVEPTSSTQPNGPEFAIESGLPNEELSPFNEDEDKVLYNQPQEEDHEEVELVSLITIVPPYYIPQHMQNFKESNFQDFEYGHSLDHEEVQHLVGTLFEVTSRSNKGSFVSNTTEFLSIAKFHVSLVMLLSVATIILNPAFATEYCDFPVIFKFGDSNSDTGGLVASLLPLTASYGDTYFHRPEGRFSDGRLTIDFMGQELLVGVKPFEPRKGLALHEEWNK
ncbi:hypothetical protein JHK87_039910 [Glycine soja]|nr:hypothetical protein JHK87_039910 [Glycine soja]